MNIIITPILQGKPWNGSTIYREALGGSEAAVAYMARSLVRAGAKVTVVCNGQPGLFDGVDYKSINELGSLIAQPWDVIISSRWPDILTAPWNTRYRILWLHDMPQSPITLYVNKIVCISEFQRRAWGLNPDHVFVSTDGVDRSVFKPAPLAMRDRNKLVWISNPDRGLPVAARIFQTLRKRWPTLELHVYGRSSVYGWGKDQEYPYLPLPEYSDGVVLHDSLPRLQLARELMSAFAMFYPTYWPETCCMAALEAQACGTPVITCPAGALADNVKGGILGYDFLNAVSQLRNPQRWEKLHDAGVEWTRDKDWDSLAAEWLARIDGWLKEGYGDGTDAGVSSPGAADKLSTVVGERV